MQVIFIHHSCFVVEVDDKVLIFDYFSKDKMTDYHFTGELPTYEPDTPVYVFASHKHRDHFDMDVLRLADYYNNIHFIFSKDCKMTAGFLKRHGISEKARDAITYVSACNKYEIEGGVQIETLRSTDAGVAFYITINGASIYHAGDLNNWKWDGAGELVNGRMEMAFRQEVRKLHNKHINLAFVPMDPRQCEYQFLGIDYMLKNTDAEYIFPMHMWQDYSGIATYAKSLSNRGMADRLVFIEHENQEFEISENYA